MHLSALRLARIWRRSCWHFVRISSYTGEQFDAETGFTYLHARYLNSALGRFLSADSVQPNAPGSQGYNL